MSDSWMAKRMTSQDDPEGVNDQLTEVKKRFGFDWPNCPIPDCEYKICVPYDHCYAHLTTEQQIEHDKECENDASD